MRWLEATLGIMLGLVALYLVLVNPGAVDQIFRSLGNFGALTFGTLQGRDVSGSGIRIGGFAR